MKNQNPHSVLTKVSIRLDAVRHNVREILRITKGLPLMAVVKANAYGHGAVQVSRTALDAGASQLAVASIEEALILRKARITAPILVLSYVSRALSRDTLREAIEKNIELAVYDRETLHLLSTVARERKKAAKIHIKIDTGTTRVGIFPREFIQFFELASHLPYIEITGVFTHFAESEHIQSKRTQQQINALRNVKKKINGQNSVPKFHAACSAALLAHPASHFDMGRLGIALYGLWPDETMKRHLGKSITLRPVLTWTTKIIQVKTVPKGTRISYDGTYTTKQKSRIAILPVGYADGMPRSLSNCGAVLIEGKRAPIRGRVCMNLTMVDITHIPKAHVGSLVTLIGTQGKEEISAHEFATWANTIHYEVVTRINWNIPRFFEKRP